MERHEPGADANTLDRDRQGSREAAAANRPGLLGSGNLSPGFPWFGRWSAMTIIEWIIFLTPGILVFIVVYVVAWILFNLNPGSWGPMRRIK